MLVSPPAAFLSAVTEIIRLGDAAWQAHREKLRVADFRVFLPLPAADLKDQHFDQLALDRVFGMGPLAWGPQGEFAGLFDSQAERRLNPAAPPMLVAKAVDAGMRQLQLDQSAIPGKSAQLFRPSAVLMLKSWAGGSRSRWARLGPGLARTALALLAARPDAVGARGRAESVISAISLQILELAPDGEDDAPDGSFGERALELFTHAAMSTLLDKPDLFVPDEKLATLATAFVAPLKEEVKLDGRMQAPAAARLGQLLRGPIAYNALTALSANASMMKGEFSDNRVLGAVARSVLGDIASTRQEGFDLLQLLGPSGVTRVFNAALDTARNRPEVFFSTQGPEKDAARSLLRGVAEVMRNAPRPFDFNGGLASEIAQVGLDVAASFLRTQIVADASERKDWSRMGASVAAHVVGEVLEGFQQALGEDAPFNPFTQLLDRETAVAIVKLVASAAAETPGMITGAKAGPEVRNTAAAIARFMAADSTRLLKAEDWRAVVAVALSESAKNPGVLFGIDPTTLPEAHVGVRLIGAILSQAGASMSVAGRRPGAILFGETLRDAITATLRAAANTASELSAQDLDKRVLALQTFVRRLLKMAEEGVPGAKDAPKLRMGATEWLYVYRWYVAHLLDTGDESKITDEAVRGLLVRLSPLAVQGER